MAPLSPLTIEAAANDKVGDTISNNLLVTTLDSRFHYSMNQLYDLRHEQNNVSNISNREVFVAIRRTENNSSHTFNRNMFQFNAHPSSLNRLGGRSNRSIFRPSTLLSDDNAQTGNQRNGTNYQNQQHNFNNRERAPYNGRKNSNHNSRPSSREDVHLKEAENAWKPAFMCQKPNEKDETEELYRQVRSILNKLTAKNFDILTEQFRKLKINTKEKLSGVVNLVFEKAVNEPNFSVGYAQLCNYLAERSREIVTSPTERAYFKRMLITKCQIEFEQNVANKNTIDTALAPLIEKLHLCKQNGKESQEIKEQINEEESKIRRRLVCTVRFIGELYKLDMLTTNIMNICIKSLVESKTDEKLECVCKLLTTIGRKLERKPQNDDDKLRYLNLSNYMNQLKQIAEHRIPNAKCSTRIKFMIMDVIALRANNWRPKPSAESKSNN